MIDAVILNYNDSFTTIECAKRLVDSNLIDHVIIVDNCSTDDSVNNINRILSNRIELVEADYNGGYGAGNNIGIKYSYFQYHTKYVLLCNPDTIIDDLSIKEMLFFLENQSDYVIVAPYMFDPQGIKQLNTAVRIPSLEEYIFSLGIIFNKIKKPTIYRTLNTSHENYIPVDMVSGSLFLMNSEMMIQHGMFDERLFLYCEEISLGFKLRVANKKVALLPQCGFIHNHSVSINKTFKSEVSKHKLYLISKLFVIKEYYKANPFQYAFAKIMSWISILEVWCISVFKGKIHE